MVNILFIEHDNTQHPLTVEPGGSVMLAAVTNGVPGIDADCGGGMACATCHVYVKEDWFNKLSPPEDGEKDMLDLAYEPKANSRLSCQITVTHKLDGLIVTTQLKQN